jgi:uncharacterized protein (DUF362 family)
MTRMCSRRQWMTAVSGAVAGYAISKPALRAATPAPTSPVAVAKCTSYGSELLPTLDRMFDQLGGLNSLVANKTVAIKINLTGQPSQRMGYVPAECAHWTHPQVIGATIHLMSKAGAKRVRLLESPWSTANPLEDYMMEAGWDPRLMTGAGSRIEFENTNYLGNAKQYSRFPVPGGGHMFRSFMLNHSYEDCDVFVSIAKLKEHATAGVTLSMKNCFGITPCTIYGDGAGGKGEPLVTPSGGRGTVMHSGAKPPAQIAEADHDTSGSNDDKYRIPRIVADVVTARPIHLAIIDGIETMAGGEGPWIRGVRPIKPGLLIAGRNPVTTDAVATALMGFDPMADRGTPPFENRDSTLRLAEENGVGTRNLNRIEVIGPKIADVRVRFRAG